MTASRRKGSATWLSPLVSAAGRCCTQRWCMKATILRAADASSSLSKVRLGHSQGVRISLVLALRKIIHDGRSSTVLSVRNMRALSVLASCSCLTSVGVLPSGDATGLRKEVAPLCRI